MLIVALNGSSNTDGNTKVLLKKVLETAENLGADTEMIEVSQKLKSARNQFCVCCSNPCSKACYAGTQLEETFELISKADAIVVGSPVYFGSMSGQLKAFFDKTRALRREKKLYNKIGAAVTVAAQRYGGQQSTVSAIHDVMLVHGMVVVGDGYIEEDCGYHGVMSQKPSKEDEKALKRCEMLGKRIVEMCNLMKK